MITPEDLEALIADRDFVKRKIEEVGESGWGIFRLTWQSRLEEIERQIAELTGESSKLASVVLTFEGDPVLGTRDIRLSFAAEALKDYQEVVSTLYADKLPGTMAMTGQLAGLDHSRLYIRDIARGSVGFVLEEVIRGHQAALLPTSLSDVVDETIDLLNELKGASGDSFEATVSSKHLRLLGALANFTETLAAANAAVNIIGVQGTASLSTEEASQLQQQLNKIRTPSTSQQVVGTVLGVLPRSQLFEFMSAEDGTRIRGPVADDFALRYETDPELRSSLAARRVRAYFVVTATLRGGQAIQEQFLLETVDFLDYLPQPIPLSE